MGIQSKDLLDQLEDLQLALEGYSLEQLTVEEAKRLKSSFRNFRIQLEEQLWKPVPGSTVKQKHTNPQSTWDPDGLIAAVSHDIRVPLQTILGFSDLLQEATLPPGKSKYVAYIRSASETLRGITDELAVYSRLKGAPENKVEVPFSPGTLLKEAAVFAEMLVEGKPVVIELVADDKLPETLLGDPSRLNRILMNLLENAAKYVTEGIILLQARTSRSREGCKLDIEIADDGIGIPEAELPFIFKPYYQAKQAGETAGRGHGLGLAIVKKLIEEQNGTIVVQSKEGKGSTFRLELPFKEVDSASHTPEKNKSPDYGRDLQGVRILVFEDNPFNAELLMTRLQSWGCQVRHADRVPLGLKMLEKQPADLILMDLRMPQMDGFQATRRIRTHQNSAIRAIPVIALTADTAAAESRSPEESGMDGLLLKPYDPRELYAILARFSTEGSAAPSAAPLGNTYVKRSDQGLISLDYLESECLGDEALLLKLVAMFKGNLLEFAGRMKLALLDRDHDAIAEAAHKVLSGLKLVQANFFLNLVEEIYEDAAEGEDISRIKSHYLKFLRHYPMLLQALECELEKRRNNGDGS